MLLARIRNEPAFVQAVQDEVHRLLRGGDSLTAIVLLRQLIDGGRKIQAMQELLDNLTIQPPLDHGRNEPVLYLDFDGVLYPYPMDDHSLEMPEDTLFKYEPLLEAQLQPYPQVKIVLSTTWAKNKTWPGALNYLRPGLQQRVVGATWDQVSGSYRVPAADHQRRLSRFEQIAADVAWRKPSAWFALDDDFKEWPSDQYHHLGWCWMTIGFNEPRVQEALQVWLDSL